MALQSQPNFNSGFEATQTGPNGVANQFISDIDERKQYRLQLAMKSAVIEQEMMAKLREEREKSSLTPGFGEGLAKFLNYNGEPPQTDQEATVLAGLGRAGIAAGKINGRIKSTIRDTGNGLVNFVTDATGKLIAQEPLTAHSPEAYKKARAAEADFAGAKGILDNLRKGVYQMQLAPDFPETLAKGAGLTLNDYSQSDPKAKAFLATITQHAQRLEYSLTHNGRVPEALVRSMIEAMPGKYDTMQTAMEKLNNIENIFESIHAGTVKAYLGSQAVPAEVPQQAVIPVAYEKARGSDLLKMLGEQTSAHEKLVEKQNAEMVR